MVLDVRQPVGGPCPSIAHIEHEGDESDDAVSDDGSQADDESDNQVRQLLLICAMFSLDFYPLYHAFGMLSLCPFVVSWESCMEKDVMILDMHP